MKKQFIFVLSAAVLMIIRITTLLFISIAMNACLSAQPLTGKMLDQRDFLIWNSIQDIQLSPTGEFVSYRLVPGEGDPKLMIYDSKRKSNIAFERTSKSNIDFDGKFMYGIITPFRDSLRNLERKKIEKSKWPCDTLFLYNVKLDSTLKIPYVTGYKSPLKSSDWLAYTIKKEAIKVDTTIKVKKSKKDIVHLIVRQLSTGIEDTLKNVKEYVWAEKSSVLIANTVAEDSSQAGGVYFWHHHDWRLLKKQKGEYSKLTISEDGLQFAFLGNMDTTKAQVPPWELFHYIANQDSAVSIAKKDDSRFPLVSQNPDLKWSDDGHYLYYGRAEMPLIKDTTLLEDEIIDVEVWGTKDLQPYTVQNVNRVNDENRAFQICYDTKTGKHISINDPEWEVAIFNRGSNSRYVLLYTEKPYQIESNWTGYSKKDLAIADLQTGQIVQFRKGLITSPRLSPRGKFAYGFSEADSTWWTYQIATGVFSFMNTSGLHPFYDELNDTPGYPNGYSSAGWTKDDQSLILYDRYDIWSWTPLRTKIPFELTFGRDSNLIYRYIRTVPDEKYISVDSAWLMQVTDTKTKSSGYAWFNPVSKVITSNTRLPFKYSMQVIKARLNETYIFQKENFHTFPDIQLSTDHLRNSERISDANPNQKDYLWGDIALIHWLDNDSVSHTGQLIKPANYDASKSYPVIVNFYERSSDELLEYPAIFPHRSTINYALYASRGYVIFNPDITYQIGSPGESVYKIVMSGVRSLIKEGIADSTRMALQGHSWGGYQIAYILTRTNLFRCAEAGAAVVNMTSAYVGIRWGTGLPRMFQYEKEQSRMGTTLWENPQRFISNSPLFQVDKITTPVLLLNNDQDSAVPYEQGIEFYLALRRLNKTAWLLNYRGEPHWPVKWQNRIDFQIRMEQFFDYYLKDEPMPKWMKEGIPAINRGLDKGY